MKYLIVSNDNKLTEQFVKSFNDYGIKTVCHIENNVHTFTLDELSEIDALVVDMSDIRVIIESMPLDSIHIITLTKKNSDTPNAFREAFETGEIKMPLSMNCCVCHDYNQNENKSTVQEYVRYLSEYKTEHDSVNNIVRYCVKNNHLKRGAYEGTVEVKCGSDNEVCSASSDVFADIVMGDMKAYRQVVGMYIAHHPVTAE